MPPLHAMTRVLSIVMCLTALAISALTYLQTVALNAEYTQLELNLTSSKRQLSRYKSADLQDLQSYPIDENQAFRIASLLRKDANSVTIDTNAVDMWVIQFSGDPSFLLQVLESMSYFGIIPSRLQIKREADDQLLISGVVEYLK